MTVRLGGFRDELLAACTETLLTAPVGLLGGDLGPLVPALKVALTSGASHLPTAVVAVGALERWREESLPLLRPHLGEVGSLCWGGGGLSPWFMFYALFHVTSLLSGVVVTVVKWWCYWHTQPLHVSRFFFVRLFRVLLFASCPGCVLWPVGRLARLFHSRHPPSILFALSPCRAPSM